MGWPIDNQVYAVRSVEEAGIVEMYDIGVEGSHTYLVNGILSHNTLNLKPGTSEETLSDLYMEFLPELKGVTVYPEGSRPDQPLTPISLDEARQLAMMDDTSEGSDGQDSCKSGKCDIRRLKEPSERVKGEA